MAKMLDLLVQAGRPNHILCSFSRPRHRHHLSRQTTNEGLIKAILTVILGIGLGMAIGALLGYILHPILAAFGLLFAVLLGFGFGIMGAYECIEIV